MNENTSVSRETRYMYSMSQIHKCRIDIDDEICASCQNGFVVDFEFAKIEIYCQLQKKRVVETFTCKKWE